LRRDANGWWERCLYGDRYRGTGPWHGLVGNVRALAPALDETRRARLLADTEWLLEDAAVVEDGLVNWPFSNRPQLVSPEGEIRLQFCCGAPGIVATASDYLPRELLLVGAELAWRAGPPGMEKGPCVCHGTAGIGYAFLKVFERTGDERWLDHARSASRCTRSASGAPRCRRTLSSPVTSASRSMPPTASTAAADPVFDVL
jgi:hypothetical protein